MISQIFSGFSPGFFPQIFFPDFFPDYSHRNKIRFYWTMKTKNRNQGFCVRLREEIFVLNRGLTVASTCLHTILMISIHSTVLLG